MYPPLIPLVVTNTYMGEEGHKRPGDRIRVTEQRARYLIELGNARLDRAGPAQTKPAGALEAKKPSGAPTTGPLTGSQSSSAPGKAAPASSSPAAPASGKSTSTPSAEPAPNAFRRRRNRAS